MDAEPVNPTPINASVDTNASITSTETPPITPEQKTDILLYGYPTNVFYINRVHKEFERMPQEERNMRLHRILQGAVNSGHMYESDRSPGEEGDIPTILSLMRLENINVPITHPQVLASLKKGHERRIDKMQKEKDYYTRYPIPDYDESGKELENKKILELEGKMGLEQKKIQEIDSILEEFEVDTSKPDEGAESIGEEVLKVGEDETHEDEIELPKAA